MAADPWDQPITVFRGEDPVIPVVPDTPAPCPAAMVFTVAAQAEGDPLFTELTVGAGITITDPDAGEFTIVMPRVTWAAPGEYLYSLFDLEGDRALLAAGPLYVRASARRPL